MTPMQRIEKILADRGFSCERVQNASNGQTTEILTLLLQIDEDSREHVLLIEPLPDRSENDPVAVLSLSLTYPFYISDITVVPELMRLLLWMNRFLPIGHFGFSEEEAKVYFIYNLIVEDWHDFSAQVIGEAVGMIAFYTRAHGNIIDMVIDGEATCEDVLDEVQRFASETLTSGVDP